MCFYLRIVTGVSSYFVCGATGSVFDPYISETLMIIKYYISMQEISENLEIKEVTWHQSVKSIEQDRTL